MERDPCLKHADRTRLGPAAGRPAAGERLSLLWHLSPQLSLARARAEWSVSPSRYLITKHHLGAGTGCFEFYCSPDSMALSVGYRGSAFQREWLLSIHKWREFLIL